MRRRTRITSFTVTCATPGCARAQSVPLVHPGWRIKPSLRIKASTEGFFVCLFVSFFSLKILMDIIVKMAWNCRQICEEVLRSKTTTTLSAQSYPEKRKFWKWNVVSSQTQPTVVEKKVHGQPCDSVPITFIHFACVSKSLAVGCVAGDKVILQTSNSELDGTAAHKRNVGDCTKINCKLEN